MAAVFGFPFDKNYVKAHGWIDAPRLIPVRDGEISWAQAYERRMRRFNLEVIVLALSALTILTAWLFIVEWALFKIAVLSRHLG